MYDLQPCESCGKDSFNPLCPTCLNTLFDEYEKDELYGGENVTQQSQPIFGLETQTA